MHGLSVLRNVGSYTVLGQSAGSVRALTVNSEVQTYANIYAPTTLGSDGDVVVYDATVRAAKWVHSRDTQVKTLGASAWSDLGNGIMGIDLSADFDPDVWDIEISISSTATAEQRKAFINAQLVGDDTTNAILVNGRTPTIDIPVKVWGWRK